MNIKLNILTAAILAGFSTVALSQPEPPAVPGIYATGPQSPLVASTDLSAAERTAYANYEAVLQIAEAKIHASSCSTAAGSYPVTAFSDGSLGTAGGVTQNFVTVLSNGSSFTVQAWAVAPDTIDNRGQQIQVYLKGGIDPVTGNTLGLVGTGTFLQTNVRNYVANLAYNGVNNMMDSSSSVEIVGINNRFDKYYGKVIKDFYRGALDGDTTNPEFYNIYDWGLQSLDKIGYPVNKYWQRSKSHRDDGTIGRTVFVKDRLVGATSCRIVIDTTGNNNQDFFSQKGWLRIEAGVTPGTVVTEFSSYPF